MPYRRIPTTDAARIRALKAATGQAEQLPVNELAFHSRYLHPLRNATSQLEGARHQQNTARAHLLETIGSNQGKLHKTKMYLSHFIQVFNLAVAREEIPANARTFYGLEEDDAHVPPMTSDELVFEWGKKIIEGESKRVSSGHVPIMNPTIGKVKVWYDQFKEGYYNQQTAQSSYQRANQKMAEIRKEIDQLIVAVWNEIEAHFSHLPDKEKREKASAYGVVYVWRKNEPVS
ncbi:MAG: hypothetical protein J7L89_03245 [Bacteroidales bacterium]|nr:hypothetical protein [Bacteroidales bacterium]